MRGVLGWIAGSCLLLGCASGRAERSAVAAPSASSLPALVSTDQLTEWQRLGQVSLIDVRSDLFTYLRGHLPGAAYLNAETLRATQGGIPAQLLSARAY